MTVPPGPTPRTSAADLATHNPSVPDPATRCTCDGNPFAMTSRTCAVALDPGAVTVAWEPAMVTEGGPTGSRDVTDSARSVRSATSRGVILPVEVRLSPA